MKSITQYSWLKALRPFSLSVAIVSCSLGITLAWKAGYGDILLSVLVLVGGLLAQAGINLINDLEDLNHLDDNDSTIKQMIQRNARFGYICFALAGLIAIYLVSIQGIALAILIIFSAGFSLMYNLGAINLKHRGLAIVQVFILMGLMMVQGAYYSLAGHFSVDVFLHSIPISILISLLLLSNELRDWELDKALNVATFSVRIGLESAKSAYWLFVALCYSTAFIYYCIDLLPSFYWLALALPLLVPISHHLNARNRAALTPMTGHFFLIFGISYLLALS